MTLLSHRPPSAQPLQADERAPRPIGRRAPREPHLDLLRVLAILAVVVIHTSAATAVGQYSFPRSVWIEGVLLDSFSRWCVPLFIMVSGALLLRIIPWEGTRPFFRKRAARVGFPLLFWTLFYLAFRWFTERPFTFHELAHWMIRGQPYYHMYFLYLIAGLYFFTPMLRPFVAAAGTKWVIATAAGMLASGALATKWDWIHGMVETPPVWEMWWRYMGYFLLGAGLCNLRISRAVGITALLLFLLAGLATAALFMRSQSLYIVEYLSPNVIAMTVALFIAATSLRHAHWIQTLAEKRWFRSLAAGSLAIYLIHPVWLHLMTRDNLYERWGGHIAWIPALTLAAFALSWATFSLLRRVEILCRIFG